MTKTATNKTENQAVVYKIPAAFALMVAVLTLLRRLGRYYATADGFAAVRSACGIAMIVCGLLFAAAIAAGGAAANSEEVRPFYSCFCRCCLSGCCLSGCYSRSRSGLLLTACAHAGAHNKDQDQCKNSTQGFNVFSHLIVLLSFRK